MLLVLAITGAVMPTAAVWGVVGKYKGSDSHLFALGIIPVGIGVFGHYLIRNKRMGKDYYGFAYGNDGQYRR